MKELELWAGVEATIHRLGDNFYEQLDRTGHKYRLSDLDLIRDINFKRIRYPILMEQLAPSSLTEIDFTWSDERLSYLKENKIDPIVGLLHHGSGARYTSLIDDEFPEKLATYAEAIAKRYPWVDAYTPVNEPLTTARFSGLYSHWFPHGRSNKTMLKILLNECKATVLSMKAIREINPSAQLIQTEDIGRTVGCPTLQYQIDFDNYRRWLTFDLLCGRINKDYPLWKYLMSNCDEKDILWFQDNPCPPDILGVNYYITSERALDSRIHFYPEEMVGGNEKDRYVDIELVRVGDPIGFYGILKEVWERYNIPVAITEVHIDCDPKQQAVWIREAWDDAIKLRGQGADIRAVTIWSIFGAYDWNSLLTKFDNYYEPGIFDVSSGTPKPTELYHAVKEIGESGQIKCFHAKEEGWWKKPERYLYPRLGS